MCSTRRIAAPSVACALYIASPIFIAAWLNRSVACFSAAPMTLLSMAGLRRGDRRLGLALLLRADLVAVLLQVLVNLMDQPLGVIAQLDRLAPGLVGLGIGFGLLHHALDVGLGMPEFAGDADLLILARGLVLRVHRDDAVRVDVERDLDLRHAARRRRDAHQVELAESNTLRQGQGDGYGGG